MTKRNTKKAGPQPALTNTLLRLALHEAAMEAYQAEVVDTGMVDLTIGEDMDYATAGEWRAARMDEWLAEAEKKWQGESAARSAKLPAVRVSLAEQEAISRKAAQMNLTVSEYVRRQALR
jgi:hypothetical protein